MTCAASSPLSWGSRPIQVTHSAEPAPQSQNRLFSPVHEVPPFTAREQLRLTTSRIEGRTREKSKHLFFLPR